MKYNRLFTSLIIYIIIIDVFANCKNNSTSKQVSSREPQILKGQKIELSDTYSAIDLEIVDSMLIFLCYGDQYKFHVYNKNTLKFVGKFGQEGRGPSEYILPIMLSQKMKVNDSIYLVTYDNSLRRINFVNILKAINNVNYCPVSINSRDRESFQLSIITSAVMSSDSLFIGTSGDNSIEGRFFCYDILNDKLTWEPYYPIPKIVPKKMFQAELYANYLALRFNKSDIAVASLFFKRIDILDNKGRLKRSIVFNQDKEPDFSNADSWPIKGSHEYFTSISVSQDYIYALDIDLEVDSREIIDTAFLVKVLWDEVGTQPEIYKITPKVLKVRVDEENNRIFGLKPFNSFIYIYNMGT